MVTVLLSVVLLVSPLIGSVAACKGQNEKNDGWTLVTNGITLKAYPELREYVWQKNASLAPNGPYDKIGLHRLVNTGITPKGVVFILGCPMWGVGEQMISNPPGDSWTKYANYSQAIYWANRGFDVYAIDYRSHFIPTSLNASQLSFMADWGWNQWISDTKEAANKVKAVSGSEQILHRWRMHRRGSSLKLRDPILERRP